MKKIIVTILAFFMAVSLFAADPSPVKTEVQLILVLEPEYLMGVTTQAPADGDTELKSVVNTITMTYDQDTYKLNNTDGSHFVSYIFTEYKKCTLSAKLDGNLILDGASTTPGAEEKVAFEADIEVSTSDTRTLKSTSKDSTILVTIAADATKKDQRVFGSFNLVLKGSSESTDIGVKGKKIGTYKANLVLTVTETA